MNKIFFILISLSLMITSVSKAQDNEFTLDDLEKITVEKSETTENIGQRQKYLLQNQIAPFEGLLLNPEAMAIIITEYENYVLRSNLALETQRKSDLLKINLETKKLRLELEAQKKKSDIEIQGRDKEISSCHKINKKINEDRNHIKRKIFLGAGSGAAGVVIGLLIGLFAI